VAERLAEEVDGAALPGTLQGLRDRGLEAGVRVGDDQLYSSEAALDQATEEAAPERFGLALAHVEADHLAVARLVHRIGQHRRLRHNAAAVADFLDLGVEPKVGVAALQGPVPERLDLLVEALADAGDLALGDP
jgi:hypothetical protein